MRAGVHPRLDKGTGFPNIPLTCGHLHSPYAVSKTTGGGVLSERFVERDEGPSYGGKSCFVHRCSHSYSHCAE